jgi:hypothetical protein
MPAPSMTTIVRSTRGRGTDPSRATSATATRQSERFIVAGGWMAISVVTPHDSSTASRDIGQV